MVYRWAAYPGMMISKILHIRICVRNFDMIIGCLLPKPVNKFDPHL